jgi:serine phosphatase RsbU (regulator of sigma subunit)
MALLNEALISQNLSQATFATAIYGVIDIEALRVTFSRGGHPTPLLLDARGQLYALEVEGSLLGIFPDEQFAETTVQLSAGDRMIIQSDGVEVAFSEDQTLDTQKWRRELQQRAGLSAEQLIHDFASHIDSESGSITPKDDLTMIIVEVR